MQSCPCGTRGSVNGFTGLFSVWETSACMAAVKSRAQETKYAQICTTNVLMSAKSFDQMKIISRFHQFRVSFSPQKINAAFFTVAHKIVWLNKNNANSRKKQNELQILLSISKTCDSFVIFVKKSTYLKWDRSDPFVARLCLASRMCSFPGATIEAG